jgi:hypothetical protein
MPSNPRTAQMGAETRLALWRCSLAEHDEILRDDLDELEAHVRASVAAYCSDGMSAEDAARRSIADLGAPVDIAREYATMDPTRVWRRRVRRMLLGPLVAQAVCLPLVTLTGLVSWLLMSNGHGLAAVAWPSALVCCGVALALVAAGIHVAGGRPESLARWLRHAMRRGSSSANAVLRPWAFPSGAALVGVLWVAPATLAPVNDEAQPGYLLIHMLCLMLIPLLLPLPLVAAILWSHARRGSIRRVSAEARAWAVASSRDLRWMLFGVAVMLVLGLAGPLVGMVCAGLAWHAMGSYDQMAVAYVSANICLARLAATGAVQFAHGRPRRALLAADRLLRRWRAASNFRAAATVVSISVVGVVGVVALLVAAVFAFRAQRFHGFTQVGQFCAVGIHGVTPLGLWALFTLLDRPRLRLANGGLHELTR